MSSDESINNVLKALYQSSSTIKLYVDAVVAGNKVPYTILIKDSEMERNELFVNAIKEYAESQKNVDFAARDGVKGGAQVVDELLGLLTKFNI